MRRTEVGFVANVTLESEPIQKTVTIEVLRVPVFGNEDRGNEGETYHQSWL